LRVPVTIMDRGDRIISVRCDTGPGRPIGDPTRFPNCRCL
jgi:hypothetical protein